MPYHSLNFVLLLACAILYYRVGEFEGSSRIVWAALSVLLSVVMWRFLDWGCVGILVGQAGLFAVITVIRTSRKS